MRFKKIFPVIFIISLITIVSAYGWNFPGYYGSPSDFLENEWVRFGLIFILFFAIVFFAVSKTFKENKGAAVAVAVAVSLFITMAVAQRGWLYSYAGDEIGEYLFIIAIILAIVFFIKVITSLIGGLGLFITLFLIWYLFSNTGFPDALPYEIGSIDLFPFYDFLASSSFLIWTIIALIAVLVIAYAGKGYGEFSKGVKRWFWGKKKKSWRDMFED